MCARAGLVAFFIAVPGPAQAARLTDLPSPPAARAVVSFSSRDPGGGNQDWGHFHGRLTDGRMVLARATGPGRIRRIWSAEPRGTLQIELDGEVVFAGAFASLYDGSRPPFVPPLAGRSGGGCSSWVPLPFLASCLVTAKDAESIYYQVDVALGPEPWRFDAGAEGLALERTCLAAAPGNASDAVPVRATGDPAVIELDGPGEVVALRAPVGGAGGRGETGWLRVFADDGPVPCLSAPLALVLGVDPGAQQGSRPRVLDTLASGPVSGRGPQWREFRLPMPFHHRLRVRADGAAELEVEWRPLPTGHDRRILHGRFRRATAVRGQPLVVVDAAGPGHLVGVVLACAGGSGHGLSFLEGDERIVVDGREVVQGTGTEDYFSGAWYFRGGPFAHPFHAVAVVDHVRALAVMARWLVADPVPFTGQIRFELEHGSRNDAPGAEYAAMALWYGDRAAGAAAGGEPEAWSWPPPIVQPIVLVAADLWPHRAAPGRGLVEVVPGDAAEIASPWPGPFVVTCVGGDHRQLARFVSPGAKIDPPRPLRAVHEVRVEPLLPALRAMRLVGPFGVRTARLGIDDVFGPERDPSAGATYDDAQGAAARGWRPVTSDDWTGYFDLNALMSPNDGVVAYAAATLRSQAPRRVRLVLGSDDSVKVFLNGRVVHRFVGRRGSVRDQDDVPLDLPAGDSLLMLKVEDWDGGFGFHARLEDADGVEVHPGL